MGSKIAITFFTTLLVGLLIARAGTALQRRRFLAQLRDAGWL